jgi:hypothetical protein
MTARAAAASLVLTAALASPSAAQQVTLNLQDTLTVDETEIAYGFDLGLSAQGPTRVGVEALLDLRDFQKRIPEMFAGTALLDVCGNETRVQAIDFEAEGETLALTGRLQANFFVCENVGGGSFRRGEPRFDINADVRAETSVTLAENCVNLNLDDLLLEPNQDTLGLTEENENLDAARQLLVEAIDLILEEVVLCPALPPELASLDPIYETVGPREVGDGGVGFFLSGSVDVSPATILNILTVLQNQGVLPGRP